MLQELNFSDRHGFRMNYSTESRRCRNAGQCLVADREPRGFKITQPELTIALKVGYYKPKEVK